MGKRRLPRFHRWAVAANPAAARVKAFMIPYRVFANRSLGLPGAARHPAPGSGTPARITMSLELEQVKRIATLARIAIGDDEAVAVRDQLNRILAMVEQMQAVDTSGIEPMSHAQDLGQRLREDVVVEADRRADYQPLAPEAEAGLYLVPKVIE